MIDLIFILSNKNNYNMFIKYINISSLDYYSEAIIKSFEEWYTKYSDVNWDQFRIWFLTFKHPSLPHAKVEVFKNLFDQLKEHTEIKDKKIIQEIVASCTTKHYAEKIAEKLIQGINGTEDIFESWEDSIDLINKCEEKIGKIDELEKSIITNDIEELIKSTSLKSGYKWRCPWFNKTLGPVMLARLYLIGARPETGKTTTLASEISFIAQQIPDDEVVLWFNNEEPGAAVKKRIIQAALGCTVDVIDDNPIQARDDYVKLMGTKGMGKIVVIDKSSIYKHDIEAFIKKYDYKIGLFVFDQARKLKGFNTKNNRNDVQTLQAIYDYLRGLGKTYNCPVFTVHQARGDATGMLYPNDNQLEGSQTEVQGELDVQIMIGRSLEFGMENIRGINIVKNKITSIHDKTELIIKPEIARIEEVVL